MGKERMYRNYHKNNSHRFCIWHHFCFNNCFKWSTLEIVLKWRFASSKQVNALLINTCEKEKEVELRKQLNS